jgi:thiamine biosynthesis lipoprotein
LETTLEQAASAVFAEVERFEALFSLHRSDSEVVRVNALPVGSSLVVSPDFVAVATFALELFQLSAGAFDPFLAGADLSIIPIEFDGLTLRKRAAFAFDLNGVAKGAAVDRAGEIAAGILRGYLDRLRVCVNGGGDLRFFGGTSDAKQSLATLRLGPFAQPVFRTLQMEKSCLATSSPTAARHDPVSSTVYRKKAKHGCDSSVVVLADRCLAADALTKVGLFGDAVAAERCARALGARILAFDQMGELIADHGAA